LSDNLSFPSGHSAIAFTMLLYCTSSTKTLIFGTLVVFICWCNCSFRLANNKHFASDVLAGAGIGMASGIIFSHLSPLKSFRISQKSNTTAFVYPQIGNQIGLGAIINPNFITKPQTNYIIVGFRIYLCFAFD
jgi:hypothetical protein